MRYVGVRGLNNFQSCLTPRKVPSVIRSYRGGEATESGQLSGALAVILPAAQKNVVPKTKTPTKAQSLGIFRMGEETGSLVGKKKKSAEAEKEER